MAGGAVDEASADDAHTNSGRQCVFTRGSECGAAAGDGTARRARMIRHDARAARFAAPAPARTGQRVRKAQREIEHAATPVQSSPP